MGRRQNAVRVHSQTSCLITIPNMHWLHKLVVHRLLLLQQDARYRVTVSLPSNKPFENNLHHIINDFMA